MYTVMETADLQLGSEGHHDSNRTDRFYQQRTSKSLVLFHVLFYNVLVTLSLGSVFVEESLGLLSLRRVSLCSFK